MKPYLQAKQRCTFLPKASMKPVLLVSHYSTPCFVKLSEDSLLQRGQVVVKGC